MKRIYSEQTNVYRKVSIPTERLNIRKTNFSAEGFFADFLLWNWPWKCDYFCMLQSEIYVAQVQKKPLLQYFAVTPGRKSNKLNVLLRYTVSKNNKITCIFEVYLYISKNITSQSKQLRAKHCLHTQTHIFIYYCMCHQCFDCCNAEKHCNMLTFRFKFVSSVCFKYHVIHTKLVLPHLLPSSSPINKNV